MKEPRFITAKEEKVNDAVYYIWFAAGWFLLTVIVSVIQDGGFKALKEMLIIGGVGAVLFLGIGAVTWIQGKMAQHEREQIMENGQAVTGIVTEVKSEIIWAGRWRKTQRYRVIICYQDKEGRKTTWYSPQYYMNPYDYGGLQQECRLYAWGDKGCLADVPKRKQVSLKEQMGMYSFLCQETEDVFEKNECRNVKDQETDEIIITRALAKNMERKYRIEEFRYMDTETLQEAKDEWWGMVGIETDAFLRLQPEILRLATPIGSFTVFVEVRFISKKICPLKVRRSIERELDSCIREYNFQYLKSDYEFLKSHIQSRMEESARKHFGRIPVTEVVLELL